MCAANVIHADMIFISERELDELFFSAVPKGQMRKDATKMIENLGLSFSYGVWLLLSTCCECFDEYKGRSFSDEYLQDILFKMNEDPDFLYASDTLVKVSNAWTDIDLDRASFTVVDRDRPEEDYSKRQMNVMDCLERFIVKILDFLDVHEFRNYEDKIIFVLTEDGILFLAVEK